jgi:hypothetical protein
MLAASRGPASYELDVNECPAVSMASQKDLNLQSVFEVRYALAANPIAHPLTGDAQSPGKFLLTSAFRVTPRDQTGHQLLDLRRVHNYTKTYTD